MRKEDWGDLSRSRGKGFGEWRDLKWKLVDWKWGDMLRMVGVN